MNYLEHQKEFGQEFDNNLKELDDLLKRIYSIRDQNNSRKDNLPIRLHSSTLDASSAFACISAILENRITMGETVKIYEESYSKYLGSKHRPYFQFWFIS